MDGIQLAQLVNSLLLLAVFTFLAGAEASHQKNLSICRLFKNGVFNRDLQAGLRFYV